MSLSKCGLHVINASLCHLSVNFTGKSGKSLHETTFHMVVELYLISLLCFVGLFGNIVSIVVLRKDKERKEALFLLQALAIADGLYLIVALLRYPLKYIVPDELTYTVMQPYVFPLLKVCQAIAIWMMVLVTIDRFIYVCHPLRAPLIFNSRSRRIMAISVFVICFLYNLPRFFDSCIRSFFNPCTNTTVASMVYVPAFHNVLYFDIYMYGLYLVLLYVGPLSILTFMNFRLVKAIKHSIQRHRDCSGNNLNDNNATLVLIIIVLVFLVCETPELILKVIILIDRNVESMQIYDSGVVSLTTISKLLMVINSSVNFFIYLTFGKRFRKVLRETFDFKTMLSTTAVTRESVPLQNHVRYQNHIYRVQ